MACKIIYLHCLSNQIINYYLWYLGSDSKQIINVCVTDFVLGKLRHECKRRGNIFVIKTMILEILVIKGQSGFGSVGVGP